MSSADLISSTTPDAPRHRIAKRSRQHLNLHNNAINKAVAEFTPGYATDKYLLL
jgi:hypothetical protein